MRLIFPIFRFSYNQTGAVEPDGFAADHNCIAPLPQSLHPLPCRRRSYPLAVAGSGGDFTVERHRHLEQYIGAFTGYVRKKRFIKFQCFCPANSDFDFDICLAQYIKTIACVLGIEIFRRTYHPLDISAFYRFGTRRCSAISRAGFKCYIYGRTFGVSSSSTSGMLANKTSSASPSITVAAF